MYTFLNTFPIHYYIFFLLPFLPEKEILIFLRRKRHIGKELNREERAKASRCVMKLFISEICRRITSRAGYERAREVEEKKRERSRETGLNKSD
jgi:hypothetical protein